MIRTRGLEEVRAAGDARWFQPALERLAALHDDPDPALRGFFAPERPVVVARAPGRLDVMGGIADYSGALVLELPLAHSTFAAVQRQAEPRCELVTLREGRAHSFSLDVEPLVGGSLRTADALAAWFGGRRHDRWAAYVVGVAQVCLQRARPAAGDSPGFRLLVDSSVPEGKGISSSAALEVASMLALTAAYGVELPGEKIAAACQWVENHVVGAPCGIMDQMTSVCGRRDRLLRLLCQPGSIEGYVTIPAGYRFYGIDSGIRHAVTGADYGTVRTAAFMGYRMIAEAAGLRAEANGSRLHVDDRVWHGYLANLAPEQFDARFRPLLPAQLAGSDFLERYAGITDTATRVLPERVYPVREATAHPVYENHRVQRFAALLEELPERPEAAEEMGRLMLASHASYGACGLGSEGTDRLVELVREAGPAAGLFGAKITGGGSGGTVAVFGRDDAEAAVREVARRYAEEAGRAAELFLESGPGAAETGVLALDAGFHAP